MSRFSAYPFPQGLVAVAVLCGGLFANKVAIAATSVDDEALYERIAPVAKVLLAPVSAAGGGVPRTGEELYNTVCAACHGAGVAGAPKFGDKAAWAPRLGLGLDGLLKSAITGKNAMPPRAGSNASDYELARAIVYMANKAGAGFKEPAALAK